ncbi:MAG: GNAT family N-acetyltransferase [Anaerolineales bacterium]
MPQPNELTIRPFQAEDQAAAKNLILDGLRERWKNLDPSKNPDLDDIAASYSGGRFRVAVLGGRIVGTGALVPRAEGEMEVRRMSVRRDLRRRGIGGAILRRLIEDACASGCRRIILETTSDWKDAVAFYQKRGFCITHRQGGDTYFLLELNPGSASVV